MEKTLRLILGDQLNRKHSWYTSTSDEVTFLMAEMRQETDYVKHHIQKVLVFFAAMRDFADWLESSGHNIIYVKISDPNNPQELEALIQKYVKETGAGRFEYQFPDEYRLDSPLKKICDQLEIETGVSDTEHFYTSRDELKSFFKGKKQLLMESFTE